MKNKKVFLKILLLLIISIIAILLFPKNSFAVLQSSWIYTGMDGINGHGNGNNYYVDVSNTDINNIIFSEIQRYSYYNTQTIFANRNLFCVEPNTNVSIDNSTMEYIKTSKVQLLNNKVYINEVDTTNIYNIAFLNGLASILEHDNGSRGPYQSANNTEQYLAGLDDVQMALWAYIYKYDTSAFGFTQEEPTNMEWRGTFSIYNRYVDEYGNTISGLENNSEYARDYYDTAVGTYNEILESGTSIYNLEFYLLTNDDYQDVIVITNLQQQQPPSSTGAKILLGVKKVVSETNIPLSGAEFKITPYSNVDSITVQTLITGADGLTALPTVNITANTGWFDVIIEETKVPTGYYTDATEKLYGISYDTTYGNIIGVVEYGYYNASGDYYKHSSPRTVNYENNHIIMYNSPQNAATWLGIKKLESGTNAPLSGAEFKITPFQNVDSITQQTLTTGADGLTIQKSNIDITVNTGWFDVIIEETKVPTGYYTDAAKKLYGIKYDTISGSIIGVVEYGYYNASGVYCKHSSPITVNYENNHIIMYNKQKTVNINIEKYGSQSNIAGFSLLSGAKFQIEAVKKDNDSVSITKAGLTESSTGKFYIEFENSEFTNGSEWRIYLTETTVPSGYKSELKNKKYIGIFKVVSGQLQATTTENDSLTSGYSTEQSSNTIKVYNEKIPKKLTLELYKVLDTKQFLPNGEEANFSIKFYQKGENIANKDIKISGTGDYTSFKNIEIQPNNFDDITVEITEESVTAGYDLADKIILLIKYDNTKNGWTIDTVQEGNDSLGKFWISELLIDKYNNLGYTLIYEDLFLEKYDTNMSYIAFQVVNKIPEIKLKIKKVNPWGNIITDGNATFYFEVNDDSTEDNNIYSIGGKTRNMVFFPTIIKLDKVTTDGETEEIVIKPKTLFGKVKFFLKESVAPLGYKKLTETVTVTIEYSLGNITNISFDKALDRVKYVNGNVIQVSNELAPLQLQINKRDFETNGLIPGANFEVDFRTSESTTNSILSINSSDIVETSDGIFDIKITDNNSIKLLRENKNSLYVFVNEIIKPSEYGSKIEGAFCVGKFTIENETNLSKIIATNDNIVTVDEGETVYNCSSVIQNSNIITVYNYSMIVISGTVWLDQPIDPKGYETEIDGKMNIGIASSNDRAVEGVLVKLFNCDTEKYIQNTKTDSEGKYEFKEFPGRYKVEFTYDGINYEEIRTYKPSVEHTDSKATDDDRNSFNRRFTTIEKDIAKGKLIDETQTETSLNYSSEYNDTSKMWKSKLITTVGDDQQVVYENSLVTSLKMGTVIEGTNPDWREWVDNWFLDGFEMKACTDNTYTSSNSEVNLGLVARRLDLSLKQEVSTVTERINGKEETYEYNNWKKENKLDDKTPEAKYTIDINKSDYNYRLGDYNLTDTRMINSQGELDVTKQTDISKIDNDNSNELNFKTTYAVYLKNLDLHDGTVNSIVYYYDSNYTFVEAKDDAGYTLSPETPQREVNIGGTRYNKMTFSGLNIKLSSGEEQKINLTFTTNTFPNINQIYNNIAEITSYSTDNGYIDMNSAPDNAIDSGDIRYENDTDNATLETKQKTIERSISGYVWADTNKNGIMDTGEYKINDVIVQLVELKDITLNGTDYHFEYIWQETKSGSDKTKKIILGNSVGINDDEHGNTEYGKYVFSGFIPGNYIIRFIYGDGTTVTYGMTGNMINYNGQDYKSTIDKSYNVVNYSSSNYGDGKGDSVARDNESRRLFVMSYSTLIDSEKGMLLDLLNKAIIMMTSHGIVTEIESIILPSSFTTTEKEILISAYNKLNDSTDFVSLSNSQKSKLQELYNDLGPDITDITETELNKLLKIVLFNTWMNADTSKVNIPIESNGYGNMNFGLAVRPKNKLVLEKHIDSIKITPNELGANSIVEATKKTGGTDDTVNVELKGIRKGLTAFNATRTEKNFWKLETDIEELLQGTTLEVTYRYTVKQDGEKDYLDKDVIDIYENNNDQYATYLQILSILKDLNKKADYDNYINNNLGEIVTSAYYTGETSTESMETLSRVNGIKDYYEHVDNSSTSTETEDLIFTQENNNDFTISNKSVSGTIEKEKNKAYLLDAIGYINPKDFYIMKVITNNTPTEFLDSNNSIDDSKTVKVTKQLSSFNKDNELTFDSYIAQITSYSTATGRRDIESVPGNLDYVYSEDEGQTLQSNNEPDEFWAERVIITKPTGEDKTSITTIVLITTSALAVITIATIVMKKCVIIKKH